MLNNIDAPHLCHDVNRALIEGRSETSPVVVLVGVGGGDGAMMWSVVLLGS